MIIQRLSRPSHCFSLVPCLLTAGSNVTWWNIYPSNNAQSIALPSCDYGPLLFFAGNWGAPSSAASDDSERRRRLLATDNAAAAGPAPAHSKEDSASSGNVDEGSNGQERVGALAMLSYCSRESWRVEDVDPGKQLWPADVYSAMVTARQERRVFF